MRCKLLCDLFALLSQFCGVSFVEQNYFPACCRGAFKKAVFSHNKPNDAFPVNHLAGLFAGTGAKKFAAVNDIF